MKNTLLAYTLGTALCALASCQTASPNEKTTFAACAADSKTVRTVSEVKGTLLFDPQTQEYSIRAAQPGTIDVVDVGVVCGSLPESWKSEGRKVVFSGTYKEYGTPPNAPAGTTFYHLELNKLTAE